ncbi:MAG: plasmid pRiA4b ORF-3 family protein [Euryarchaeota archaeon]|nr:plasmid pRiA4b ORF-3 family protein [Euryarchaeota archaeon]
MTIVILKIMNIASDDIGRKGMMDGIELRISVNERKPPIWRRIVVHPETTLEELHGIIALIFEVVIEPSHHFKFGRDMIRPDDPRYGSLRISTFEPGNVIEDIFETGKGDRFRVKVVKKERYRSEKLPVLIGGMRRLATGLDEYPYDIMTDQMESELRRYRRYDDKITGLDGRKVEPWQVASMTHSDVLYKEMMEELIKFMPLSSRAEKRMRAPKRLEPVPEKVPPGTPIEIRVKLANMPVPVWRRLLVRSEITFHELHIAIQFSFGWNNYHLYEFRIGDSSIQSFDEDDVEDFPMGIEVVDASLLHLRDVMVGKGWSIPYIYDFGDGWTHVVKVTKIGSGAAPFNMAELLDGSGACPPEDCGGPYGYMHLIKKLNDPDDPEHEEMAECVGEDRIDPKKFDVEEAKEHVRMVLS